MIIIWDLEFDIIHGKKINLGKLEGHANPVTCLAFSPDDKFLCSGSEDKNLILWNLNDK